MATPAHCYFCFEVLSAAFKRESHPSLAVVEELWEEHERSKELVIRAADETRTVDGDDSLADEHGDEDGEEQTDRPTTSGSQSSKLKIPRITRLQGRSHSGSSNTSTPSVLSASSSRSALTNASSVTTPSSASSAPPFFSLSGQRTSRLEDTAYPLFVTWNTLNRHGDKSLRGCIGTFEAQDLEAGLKSYALTSAFDDTRFSPIPASLLPSLSCSLTLLSTFESCSHPLDWDLGTHGLRISFVYRGRRHGATYLPDVPVEQGWTQEETVESLMRKAGWDGSSSVGGSVARRFLRASSGHSNTNSSSAKPWEDVSDFKTVRYQGLQSSATYAEWQEWRNFVISLDGSGSLLKPAK